MIIINDYLQLLDSSGSEPLFEYWIESNGFFVLSDGNLKKVIT